MTSCVKRLIKKSSKDLTLYHGTVFDNLENILQNGMLPDERGLIFLTGDQEVALFYSKSKWKMQDREPNNYWVVLEVNVNSDDLEPDKDDCPECETWQDSLAVIGQVAMKKNIPTTNILNLYFYNPFNKSLMYQCSVGEYMSDKETILSKMKKNIEESWP